MTRARRVTSSTWQGLPPEARADLHASEHVHGAADRIGVLLAGLGVELAGDAERELRATLSTVLRGAYLAGTERETALAMAVGAERSLRLRYERALLEAGLVPPRLSE